MFVIVLLLISLGLALTWTLDQVGEVTGGRRAALREIHRYGQARGWERYTLELESVDSANVVVRVAMLDSRVHTCRVSSPLVNLVGDTSPGDVACEP